MLTAMTLMFKPSNQTHGGEPESKSYVQLGVAHIVYVGAPIGTSTFDSLSMKLR